MKRNKKLIVDDLTVSFRTTQGFVRAVRGISFDLYEGETLAIVGESGSGKSVSSKSIMGILEGNAIIDKGHIYYENQDLTTIDEENFHKIRGKKIGMIFQDPLSSLNPIMKIGKQITEALLINGNRLKNRFKDMIHEDRMNLINTKAKVKVEVKELKSKFKEDKKQLIEANKNDEIAKLKEKLTADIETARKKTKDAASKLNATKVEAKKRIRKDYLAEKERINKQIIETKEKQLANRAENEKLVSKAHRKYTDSLEEIKKLKANFIENKQQLIQEDKVIDIPELKEKYIEDLRKANEVSKKLFQEFRNAKNRNKMEIEVLRESLRRYRRVTKLEAKERALKVMAEVGIPDAEKRLKQYPFQFSGGMRQRIVIAIALTLNPDVLICDEPTTALDVTIQAQILELIKEIKTQRSLSIIFITHDLGVVANMADRVAVMYAGKIVEIGTSDEIFYNPKHPYTWALLSSMPDLDSQDRLASIPGTPPNMLFPPKGDAFAERNQYAMKIDYEQDPPYFKVSDTHYAATWLLHKDAPKVEIPEVIRKRISKMQNHAPKEVNN